MTEGKLPFGLGRFFARHKSLEAGVNPPKLVKRDDLFRPEESMASFYASGKDSEETIREQLAKQFPKILRKLTELLQKLGKRENKEEQFEKFNIL